MLSCGDIQSLSKWEETVLQNQNLLEEYHIPSCLAMPRGASGEGIGHTIDGEKGINIILILDTDEWLKKRWITCFKSCMF